MWTLTGHLVPAHNFRGMASIAAERKPSVLVASIDYFSTILRSLQPNLRPIGSREYEETYLAVAKD